MGIGSVTSTNSMSSMRMLTAVSSDSKIKNIQNEITNAKQQMQKISPKEELSVAEKETERRKLQKEISSLNTELKQHQEELRKSQTREIRMAELQEDQKLTKEEKPETSLDKADEKNQPNDKQQTGRPGTVITSNSDGTVIFKGIANQDEKSGVDTEEKQADETKENGIAEKEAKAVDDDAAKDTGLSHKKIYAIVSADSSTRQANRQGTIIANTRDGIAILKGEMNQDEKRGVDTEKKQAELEKMEKREQRVIAFQSSILGEANNTMKSAAETNVTGINDKTQVNINAKSNAFINAIKASQEETQAAQQRFHISFG
ncbi:MAG: hypothetical protein K2K19_13825 [Acetatifactor sp.]|nr:hypothetical protein [Acetatifactor sp.]